MDVTELLNRAQQGDQRAADEALAYLVDELRRVAQAMRRKGPSLTTTSLVNEAYLRIAGRDVAWTDRNHFLSYAARAMRSVLVDRARERKAAKRGGDLKALPSRRYARQCITGTYEESHTATSSRTTCWSPRTATSS